jgi:hypothetical protein
MYAGTTFRKGSGSIIGVHQKIDRVSRRHLKKYIGGDAPFPHIDKILHFEGNNGPDGIKRKSPSKDEPWHFIDPTKPEDKAILVLINDHLYNLTQALRDDNEERSAFEAAWLSHAIVDGLTPAHHYPLNDKIEELWGKPHHERLTKRDKNIIKGHNRRDTLSKNWQYWGIGGVFSAHLAFELGVASMIAPLKFTEALLSDEDKKQVKEFGFEAIFMRALHRIDHLKMYDAFGKRGWTRHLTTQAKKVLVPEIIKTVSLAWYIAFEDAQKKKES